MIYTTVSVEVILFLSLGSVIIASGQVRMTDAKVLQGDDDGQCPSIEEKQKVLHEINIITNQVIASVTGTELYTCNGTPGWRRVAFINMTDTSYDCPTGLNLTSYYSKRTCGRSYSYRFRMFLDQIQCWRFAIQPGVWADKGIPVWRN